ncbi:hypothetical protein [Hymenobacter seoulensis]
MEIEKMRLALELAAFNYTKHFENLRSENVEVLKSICSEVEFLNFFTKYSFNTAAEIGKFNFNEANEFKKQFTWEDDFKWALASNLLIVGSGISGDPVVLDLDDYQAGIVFQDYFWESEDQGLRKYLIKMNCSLGQFFLNSATIDDYPIDAYEAAAYMKSEFTGYWSPEEGV